MPPTLLMTSTAGVPGSIVSFSVERSVPTADLARVPVDAQADRLDCFGREGDLNVHRFRDRLVVVDEMSGYRQEEFAGRPAPPERAVTGALRPVGRSSPERLAGHIHAVDANLVYLDSELSRVAAVGTKPTCLHGGTHELRREHDLPGGNADVVATWLPKRVEQIAQPPRLRYRVIVQQHRVRRADLPQGEVVAAGEAEVRWACDHPHPRIVAREQLARVVDRRVVDHHGVERRHVVSLFGQRVETRRKQMSSVVIDNDHGRQGRGGHTDPSRVASVAWLVGSWLDVGDWATTKTSFGG